MMKLNFQPTISHTRTLILSCITEISFTKMDFLVKNKMADSSYLSTLIS